MIVGDRVLEGVRRRSRLGNAVSVTLTVTLIVILLAALIATLTVTLRATIQRISQLPYVSE